MDKPSFILRFKSKLPEGSFQADHWALGNEPIIIGRSKECTIRINDVKASRQHCRIEPVPEGGYKLIDLGSANGTLVNGNRVTEILLSGGETITVGGYEIGVAPADQPAPVPSSSSPPQEDSEMKSAVAEVQAGIRPARPAKKVLPWVIAGTIAVLIIITIIILFQLTKEKHPESLSADLPNGKADIRVEPESAKITPPSIQEPHKAPTKTTEAERQRRIKEAIRKVEEAQQQRLAAKEKAWLEREKRLQEAKAEQQRREPVPTEPARRNAGKREADGQANSDSAKRAPAAQKKQEEQKPLTQEQKEFNKFISAYKDLIKKYQFSKTVKLCEDTLKVTKQAELREEVWVLLDEAQRQRQIFDYLIKQLTSGKGRAKLDCGGIKFWVAKADETCVEGPIENTPGSWYSKRWMEIEPETVYGLFDLNKLLAEKEDHLFNLGIFCYKYNLLVQADRLLIYYYRRHPEAKEQIDKFVARQKGIPIPPGGFEVYHRQWVTAEEKGYLEKGYVRHEGVWMTYDEMMAAKGFVKFKGRWVTAAKAKSFGRSLTRLRKLKKQYPPTGVLSKPGADSERLAWSQARVRETDHYIIKTNLSEAALNDIAFIMESLYLSHKVNFRLAEDPPTKLKVYVYKNRREYYQIGRATPNSLGEYIFAGEKRLMSFYTKDEATIGFLFHEGTHQFIDLISPHFPPCWINEGLATYYEAFKFEGDKLEFNLIHKEFLSIIQNLLRSNRHIPLRQFVNIAYMQYNHLNRYSQGWALTYYLINAKNGRYAQSFRDYFEELKTVSLVNLGSGGTITDRSGHIDMFERIFGIPLEDLEEDWKTYILNLKAPKK